MEEKIICSKCLVEIPESVTCFCWVTEDDNGVKTYRALCNLCEFNYKMLKLKNVRELEEKEWKQFMSS